MTQIQGIKSSDPYQPNLSAVRIEINNPQVNSANYAESSIAPRKPEYTASLYNYPRAQIYEVPQKSLYQNSSAYVPPPMIKPTKEAETAAAQAGIQSQPVAPAQQATVANAASAATSFSAPSSIGATTPITATASISKTPLEIKAPDEKASQLDINEFITKLTSPDYGKQANAMEAIADIAQKSPEQARPFVDKKVIDALTGIMTNDTSKLDGPTPEQIQIREKILSGKKVTDEETAKANNMGPMELAERNKQYSIYTIALLQNVYISDINKAGKTEIPFSELPGVGEIAKQVKENQNPMVKAAGIEALSYVQKEHPEYKKDLNPIFTEAKKDKDTHVQEAATKALEKAETLKA